MTINKPDNVIDREQNKWEHGHNITTDRMNKIHDNIVDLWDEVVDLNTCKIIEENDLLYIVKQDGEKLGDGFKFIVEAEDLSNMRLALREGSNNDIIDITYNETVLCSLTIHNHSNKIVIDSITQSDVNNWKQTDNKLSSLRNELDTRITTVNDTLDKKIDDNTNMLQNNIDSLDTTLNNKIDNNVNTLQDNIDNLSDTVETNRLVAENNVSALNNRIDNTNTQITNVNNNLSSRIGELDSELDTVNNTLTNRINNIIDRIDYLEDTINELFANINYKIDNLETLINSNGNTTSIPCTSITITPESHTFTDVGQEITLTSQVVPNNTTNKILWSSTNTNIATVNNGIVTAISEGQCTIIANCGNYQDTCNIIVEIEQDEIIEEQNSITLNQKNITINRIGENGLIFAMLSESLEGKQVIWSSSDTNIAVVSSYSSTSALITSRGEGSCIITANCEGYQDTCIIEVTEIIDTTSNPCTSITISPKSHTFTNVEQEITLTSQIVPSNTTDEIIWYSSNPAIAKVENGKVTSVSKGQCTITLSCGNCQDTCNIIVNINQSSGDEGETEEQGSITLNKKNITINHIGENVLISATLSSSLNGKTVSWTSNNTSVATISSYSDTSGLIVTKGEGICVITANCEGYQDTCAIKVEVIQNEDDNIPTDIPCTAVYVTPESYTFASIGEKIILTSQVVPNNTTDMITWVSTNTNIATVNNGTVTSVSEGQCTIIANCGGYQDTCNIIVEIEQDTPEEPSVPTPPPSVPTEVPCNLVAVSPSSYSFTSVGQQVELKVVVEPINTTDDIYWYSSNPTIAKVENGKVTSMGNGEAIITVQCGNYSDMAIITVQDSTVSNDVLTGFELTSDFNVTSKNYYRVEAIPVPSTFNGEYTVWWTSSDPVVLSPSASNGRNMTFYPGRSGTCIMTVTVDAGLKGYFRKKFNVTVNIPDNTPNTEILYNNPTITVENFKAKAVQGNNIQYFDISCEPNTGHPSYNSSLELIDDDGQKCYLALTNRGTSPFGKNGLHLDSGAWVTEASESSGVPYRMQISALSWQNFDMTVRVKNLNNTVHKKLFNDGLRNISTAFPELKYIEDSSSSNVMRLVPLEEEFMGHLGMIYDEQGNPAFQSTLNQTVCTRLFGAYDEGNLGVYRQWLSTCVHEFGHVLGIADNASHHPTMYTYTRDKSKYVYLQPNDILWIEEVHKEMYGVDLMKSQEMITAQGANYNFIPSGEEVHFFDYDYNNEPNAIVECKLEFVETKPLVISEDGFALEYNIYNIIDDIIVEGEITKKQLKIIKAQEIEIDSAKRYRISVREYEKTPCSLINPNAIEIIEL